MQTKTVKLCGKEVILYLRKCRDCDEQTWFNADCHICSECSEVHLTSPAERPDRIAMSEKTYHGDSEMDQ